MSKKLSIVLMGALAFGAACSDNGPTTPDAPTFNSIEVPANTTAAYLTLGATASLATVTDPATSSVWDLGFKTTSVFVNGGASGPGGVKAYCLCANATLTQPQVEALTAQQGEDAFAAVTTASIPTDTTLFKADAATYVIGGGWYNYDMTTHVFTMSNKAWGIKLASTSGTWAKFTVAAATTAQQGPVNITLRWATQAASATTLGTDQQVQFDLSSGQKTYINLTTGTSSTSASGAWDIAISGFTITVNGGVSGTGGVTAIALAPSNFYAAYADITENPNIPSGYASDASGGTLATAPWYRYNSTTHQIWPTYDVYLVKRGTTIYKVQITNYYNTAGQSGIPTVRYAKLTN